MGRVVEQCDVIAKHESDQPSRNDMLARPAVGRARARYRLGLPDEQRIETAVRRRWSTTCTTAFAKAVSHTHAPASDMAESDRQHRPPLRDRKLADSLLEEDGFELAVPGHGELRVFACRRPKASKTSVQAVVIPRLCAAFHTRQ
jgi:hypothetical protein